ncbi:MAG: hypothetical protein M3R47_12410 [Chloroflexota bacterium]|nr:hypothetical protein [Chloroflexota bacterium]
MFALKSRTEHIIRVLLIMAILFNALVPTAAFAQAAAKSLSSEGIKRSAFKIPASSRSSQLALQDATPIVSPTNIETPRPMPSEISTSETTPVPPETLAPSATLESISTPFVTQNPSETASQTTSLTASQPSALSYTFSAAPEQTSPGDEVEFTIEVVNTGNTTVTGLSFSNILPQEFGTGQSGLRDFNFDPQTRCLPGMAPRQV